MNTERTRTEQQSKENTMPKKRSSERYITEGGMGDGGWGGVKRERRKRREDQDDVPNRIKGKSSSSIRRKIAGQKEVNLLNLLVLSDHAAVVDEPTEALGSSDDSYKAEAGV